MTWTRTALRNPSSFINPGSADGSTHTGMRQMIRRQKGVWLRFTAYYIHLLLQLLVLLCGLLAAVRIFPLWQSPPPPLNPSPSFSCRK